MVSLKLIKESLCLFLFSSIILAGGGISAGGEDRRTGEAPVTSLSAGISPSSSSNTVYSDFNGDGFDDLAISVALEAIGGISDAGAVNVLYGSSTGLRASASGTTPDDQFWHQDSFVVKDVAEGNDFFGHSSLSATD